MTDDEVFARCVAIDKQIEAKDGVAARRSLILLVDQLRGKETPYGRLVNHLLREVGLYPYMNQERDYDDGFLYYAFSQSVGSDKDVIFHRDQARALKQLYKANLVVSAPTSFGKSFIIDAYIATRRPHTIMIIVPTIALTDETRRRLAQKFGSEYRIITMANQQPTAQTIYIFPQERALLYADTIKRIDFLVIDEFYKAGPDFNDERAGVLTLAMRTFMPRAERWYCLAPNIDHFSPGRIISDRDVFRCYKEPTVVQEIHELYKGVAKDVNRKKSQLYTVLDGCVDSKTLIYANSHSQVNYVCEVLLGAGSPLVHGSDGGGLRTAFAEWLRANYSNSPRWMLPFLIERGVGVHSGKVNRMIAQMQLRLFELQGELDIIVSTSSIIEGVNTTARNVVVWSARRGVPYLDEFTFKNICGRAGRMFKHFVGHVYLLERPKFKIRQQELSLGVRDADIYQFQADEVSDVLTDAQLAKIKSFQEDVESRFGHMFYKQVFRKHALRGMNSMDAVRIAGAIKSDPKILDQLKALGKPAPALWRKALFALRELLQMQTVGSYSAYVNFVISAASGWDVPIRKIIATSSYSTDVNQYFDAERHMTFNFSSKVLDLNMIIQALGYGDVVNLMPLAERLSYAFLPPVVYQLEEYGLPRTLARQIQRAELFDFMREGVSVMDALGFFLSSSPEGILSSLPDKMEFDGYVLKWFYEGLPQKLI